MFVDEFFEAIMATTKLRRIVSVVCVYRDRKKGDNLCNLAVVLEHETRNSRKEVVSFK